MKGRTLFPNSFFRYISKEAPVFLAVRIKKKQCFKKCITKYLIFTLLISFFYANALGNILKEGINTNDFTQTKTSIGQNYSPVEIMGQVTDSLGNPLIGVTIKEKEGSASTITGSDGRFSIVVPDNAVLVVSFVGFNTKEVEVDGRENIVVVLGTSITELDQVVIVGYGKQKKSNVTGAITTIDSKSIQNKPVTSLTQALTGTAAGVTVIQSSSRPGANDESIRIRGVGTWGNSAPLVLVDGVEQSINAVNPNDVESVTVLKDAAAGAIYGSRAGNGVILITTKKGSGSGKPTIRYSGRLGIQRPTRIPDFNTTYDYYYLKNLALEGRGASPVKDDEQMKLYANGKFDPDNNNANTNWVEEVLRNAVQQEHNITISGGGKVTSYFVSLGYLDQQSVVGNQSWFKRFNMRTNTSTEISKRIKIGANMSLMNGVTREPVGPYGNGVLDVMQDALRTPPNYPVRYSDGTWALPPAVHNPVRLGNSDDYGHSLNNITTISGQVTPEIDIIDGLKLKGLASGEKSILQFDGLTKIIKYLEFTAPGSSVPSQNEGGGITRNNKAENWSSSFNYTLNATLNYHKEIGNHKLDLLLGISKESFENSFTNSKQFDLPSSDLDAIGAGTSSPVISGTKTESGILSYFGRLNYNYHERYVAEVDIRRDGSSKFAQGHRWGTFPSYSLAWNIGNEHFFEPLKNLFNSFKIRASYGLLGNNRIGDYQFLPIIAPNNSTGYSFGNNVVSQAYYESAMGNSLITWERLYSKNIGIDFGAFDNRLNVSFDLYERKTEDILLALPAPNTLGIASPTINAGSVKNSGWELTAGWNDKIGKLSYSVSGNISDVRNEILDLKGYRPVTTDLTIRQEGYPIDAIYGWVSDGIVTPNNPKTDLIDPMIDFYGGDPNGKDIVTRRFGLGDVSFKDLNHDGKIDENDKRVIGNQIPRYTYSFRLGANFHNFDLSLFFQGVGKVDGYLLYEARDALLNPGNVYTANNPTAKYPRMGTYEKQQDYNSFWVQDASYLRLKNVQIGYDFGKIGMKAIKNLKLYFSGTNIYTWTKFAGFDPESRVGMRGWGYPNAAIYSIGLDVTF